MSIISSEVLYRESSPVTLHAGSNRSRGLLLLRCMALCGVLCHTLLLFRSDAFFLTRPFIEDAFYSLSTARSLALGLGLSVDGVHLTNGVQPLICFIYAPLFSIAGSDPYLALRLVMAVQIFLYGLAALAIGWFATTLLRRTGYRREVFWLVTSLAIWSYSLSIVTLNGLETSLALALTLVSIAFYNTRIARVDTVRLREYVKLGVILGFGVLARIDIAFLVVAIGIWHLVRAHLRFGHLSGNARFAALRRTLIECAIVGGVSLLVSSPWWIYNMVYFGSLMPISGQAQQSLLRDRWQNLGYLFEIVSNAFLVMIHAPERYVGPYRYLGSMIALAALVVGVTVRPLRRFLADALALWKSIWKPEGAAPLLMHAVALAIYYTMFFGAPHFLFRYLIPLWLLIVLAIFSFLYALWKSMPAGSVTRFTIAGIATVALFISTFGLSRNFTDDGLYYNIFRYPADWIAANTSPEDRIGMFQSGTTGFLYPNVTNLDGKVNAAALHAMKEGKMAAYADSIGFDYIIDWDFYTRHVFSEPGIRSRYIAIDTLPHDFIVWKRLR